MSEDLTPSNAVLMRSGFLDRLRVALQADFTPSSHKIAHHLAFAMEQLVTAEEYDHPTLSREEAIKRAQERVDLCIGALKESELFNVKARRGDWIAKA